MLALLIPVPYSSFTSNICVFVDQLKDSAFHAYHCYIQFIKHKGKMNIREPWFLLFIIVIIHGTKFLFVYKNINSFNLGFSKDIGCSQILHKSLSKTFQTTVFLLLMPFRDADP